MIDRAVFYDRRDNYCKPCEFWRGRCRRGHSLTSPQGCPIKKFPPIQNAGYAVDQPPEPVQANPTGCCGRTDSDLQPMTWKEAAEHLAASMAAWAKTGFKITSDDVYDERAATCQDNCPHYRWFQCRLCRCLIFTKARIPTEECPVKRWKR